MIDITKKYKTRLGEHVTIIFTDGRDPYPIVGYVGESCRISTWSIEGRYQVDDNASCYDLIEIKAPTTKWMNVYKHTCCLHDSRVEADTKAGDGRIACIKITYTEGEGV